MQRNDIVGMRFAPHTHTVSRAEADAYAAATNDHNPAYARMAPPMYAVYLEMPPLMEAVKTPAVIVDPKRFLRLLHGEHDMRWHQPIVPGQTYTTEVSIARVAGKASGEIIDLRIETKEQGGALVVETLSSMFIRSEQRGEQKSDARAADVRPPEPARQHIFSEREHVAMDQSLRYADASGDHNPIHKDAEVAKNAGLPGIVLHGLCSMAFCQKAVIKHLCGGDPAKLARLKVRFAKPVLMGQTLTINAWAVEPRVFGVEARVDGVQVLKDGVAEIRA